MHATEHMLRAATMPNVDIACASEAGLTAFGPSDRLTLRLPSRRQPTSHVPGLLPARGPSGHADATRSSSALMALGGLAAVGVFQMAVTLIVIFRYGHAAPGSQAGSSRCGRSRSGGDGLGIVGAGCNLSAINGAHLVGQTGRPAGPVLALGRPQRQPADELPLSTKYTTSVGTATMSAAAATGCGR